MGHLSELIIDLALILGSAAVTTILCKILKQPVVLGYIVAGLLVGPHSNFFPTIAEHEGINTWAEIGVIFMLFGLGLEFSFKKLLKVGNVALITALIGSGMTFFMGYNVGVILGWESTDSLFLGGILCISSTMIIFRAYSDSGLISQKFAGIVLGELVIEDLIAVVLMVILSTVSISRSFQGLEMLGSIVKLVFFLILWFVSGIFFLPTIIKRLKKHLNEELLLIISLALCFLMVILSSQAGFSPALGAFIMGSILAETPVVEKIEHAVLSVKNLFGAVFFVSVGMLLDPKMLIQYALPIGVSVLVLLIWKPLFATIGALVAGQPIKVAVQSGMSLSQIGEFSFIIAALGTTLKVTSDFLYPIAVAVSVITTFTTPYMIGFSGKFSDWISTKIPEKWAQKLNQYSLGTQQVKQASDWKRILRFYLINTVIFSVIIISIIFLSNRFLFPLFDENRWQNVIVVGITLIFSFPFLYALSFRRGPSELYVNIWAKPLYRGPLVTLMFSRLLLSLFFVGFIFSNYFSTFYTFLGVVATILIYLPQRNRIKSFYKKIEGRFLLNLNDSERRELEKAEEQQVLAPWDAHLAKFTIDSNSPIIGIPLHATKIREQFGVNIVIIERGEKTMNIPSRNEMIFPNDVVSVIGTDEQLAQFEAYLNKIDETKERTKETNSVGLHSFTLLDNCTLVGQSIRTSKIRERCNGIVVGLERDENRIVNPEPETVFQTGDIIWLVGINKRIHIFLKEALQTEGAIQID